MSEGSFFPTGNEWSNAVVPAEGPTTLLVWTEAALSVAVVELRVDTEVVCGAVSVTVVVLTLSQMEGRSDPELLEAVSGALALVPVGSRGPWAASTGWVDPLAVAIGSELELGEAVC